MARRILITGAANWAGSALARELLADPAVELVAALDTRTPDLPGGPRLVFLEADVRSVELARLLAPLRLDAAVHNDVLQFAEAGRSERLLHEINVVGTLQLLAACEALPTLRSLVVRSSASIYGSEPNAPAFFTESMARRFPMRTRWQRDVDELEHLVEAFARRHPHIACTLLRPQPVVGAVHDSPLMRLFRSPVVPTWPGFDPRIQVLGAQDLVGGLRAALGARVSGPVNLAGAGTISLSRLLRRLGTRALPLAPPLLGPATAAAEWLGLPRLGPDTRRYLRYGRGVDTTRMRAELGFVPRQTTLQAVETTAEALAA
jgi:UDP-glucose 4-epimerase